MAREDDLGKGIDELEGLEAGWRRGLLDNGNNPAQGKYRGRTGIVVDDTGLAEFARLHLSPTRIHHRSRMNTFGLVVSA